MIQRKSDKIVLLSGNVESGLECAFNNNCPLYTHAVSFNAIQLNINRQIQCIRTTDKNPRSYNYKTLQTNNLYLRNLYAIYPQYTETLT